MDGPPTDRMLDPTAMGAEGWPREEHMRKLQSLDGQKADRCLWQTLGLVRTGSQPDACIKIVRLPPALRHRGASLEPIGVLAVRCNGSTLHGFSPLESVHIVTLDTAGATVRILFVLSAAFA
jgi:hypothetical protein